MCCRGSILFGLGSKCDALDSIDARSQIAISQIAQIAISQIAISQIAISQIAISQIAIWRAPQR